MSRVPQVPPQGFADAVHALTGRSTDDAMAAVCSTAQAAGVIDVVIHTGDVADHPSRTDYESAERLLNDLGAPSLITPGNHDDPVLLREVFGERTAGPATHVDVDAWRIVLLSSHHRGHHCGTFTDETLAELAALLAFDGPILIGTHHPPLGPCSHPDCVNQRSAEFLTLIDTAPNVRVVVSGHLHLADEIVRNGVTHFVTPSTALQLDHVHPLPENNTKPTPGGCRMLDLAPDGTVDSQLIWA